MLRHLRLLEVDEELRQCDDRITALEESLRATLTRKKVLHAERAKLLNLPSSAPISLVPDEVLSSIMLMASEPDEPPSEYDDEPDLEEQRSDQKLIAMMPSTLSQVDRHFRRVAISTGRLWAAIHIRIPSSLSRARMYLSRAQGCLLDIDLHIIDDDVRAQVHEVFDLLPPSDRWRSLRIETDVPYPMMEIALRRCLHPAPNLCRLELDCNSSNYLEYFDDVKEIRRAIHIFKGVAPLLQSLVVWSVPLRWDADMLHGLTRLEVSCMCHAFGPSLLELRETLRRAPNLKKLLVRAIDQTSIHYVPPCEVAVELTTLQELTLSDMQPDTAKWLLSAIATPALQSLTLDLWNNPDDGYTVTHREALDLIMGTPYAGVTRLKILCVAIDNFPNFGRQFHQVRELELTCLDIDPEDYSDDEDDGGVRYVQSLGRLTRSAGIEVPPFPSLECLKWFGPPTEDLINFVRNRKKLDLGPHKVLLNYDVDFTYFRHREAFSSNLSELYRLVPVGFYGGSRWDRQVLEDYRYGEIPPNAVF